MSLKMAQSSSHSCKTPGIDFSHRCGRDVTAQNTALRILLRVRPASLGSAVPQGSVGSLTTYCHVPLCAEVNLSLTTQMVWELFMLRFTIYGDNEVQSPANLWICRDVDNVQVDLRP
jgi:hypothetical protein